MRRLSALLLGGIVGAGAAILFAPLAGAEARRRLRQSLDDLQGETQARLEQGRLRATELIKTGQACATDLATRVQAPMSSSELADQAVVSGDQEPAVAEPDEPAAPS